MGTTVREIRLLVAWLLMVASVGAQGAEPADSTEGKELNEVVVVSSNRARKLRGVTNTELITSSELKRAACCNLGESFTTNPSVDVSYNDAATGARQIKLLGLSGTYVQMLTENVPNFRGAAAPYGLGYIAGSWMQSIQVSKGASSVKNGYESITGQINVEMKKPQGDPSVGVNLYYDSNNKLEANVDGNLHLGQKWSAGLLTHFEKNFTSHDGNDDGFMDMPRLRQVAVMPRVAYLGSSYVFQAAMKYIDEQRRSGQDMHHGGGEMVKNPYIIEIKTRRGELMTKNALMYDRENDGNVALILSGSVHDQDAGYGLRVCDIDQREVYGSLMYERKWLERHSLSSGVSVNYDNYHYRYRLEGDAGMPLRRMREHEAVSGVYGQYTFNMDEKLVAMAGLRYDYSSVYGGMVTPRMHVRYNPSEDVSVHGSAGKGYRSPHPLAEYSYLLASSRRLEIARHLEREWAWNFGGGAMWTLRPGSQKVGLSGEYYYTRFGNQLMADVDSDPHAALIYSSRARSYSHALQMEVTWEPRRDVSVGLAWRLTDVKVDYGRGLVEKPLTSRHKGLLTIGYSPMMGLWQADVSVALNGSGRMPTPYKLADGVESWGATYRPFVSVNAQVTRNFRHWGVYVGGENLTGYRQKNPIVDAGNPWGKDFDATMIYGPLHGAMVYVGVRYNFTKY